MHNSVSGLSSSVKDRVKGVVLFGDTRNLQDGRQIPNFPRDSIKIYCALGDMVCSGTLIITLAHFSYSVNVPDALSFLSSKVNA
jgi:cutinase